MGTRFLAFSAIVIGAMTTTVSAQRMYWSNSGQFPGLDDVFERAVLDGSDVETLVSASIPNGVALDLDANKLYWTAITRIQRSNLDGSGVEDAINFLALPTSIALDVAAGKMYWGDGGSDAIQRANLDGSGAEDLVVVDALSSGLALDTSAGKMYWSDSGGIRRANLDGSDVEDYLISDTGLSAIALDVDGAALLKCSNIERW